MKKINYIYFVYDTLNNEHVEKSITWSINSQNIKMIHGVDDLYILHMFHYVGRDENRYTDRGKIGHRF